MIASRSRLSGTDLDFYPITSLPDTSGLPMTVKVLLEGMIRLAEAGTTNEQSVRALAAWPAKPPRDAGLPVLPPAGHGHLPPGEPRIRRQGGPGARDPGPQSRDPRHTDGHRFAYDHGQRARRARVGSRRHRGRGGDAGPARIPRNADRRRRALPWGAARGIHRHRPRADSDRDA